MDNDLFHIYAIYSYIYNRIYVGMAINVDHRIHEHNSGKVFSTKPYRPWIQIFSQLAGSSDKARKLEKYYKSAAGKRKLRKILSTLNPGSLPD